MKRARRDEIRQVVLENIFRPLWKQRRTLAPGAQISKIGLLPIRPDRVITELLRMRLEMPEELEQTIPGSDSFVGGILDRRHDVCFWVAGKLPPTCQRFTLAHEIGHYFMHPGLVYHRDLPVVGSERMEIGRSMLEVEADVFAAELMIPRRMLRDLFAFRYGGPISPDDIDERLVFRLVTGLPMSPATHD